jgi:urea transporter
VWGTLAAPRSTKRLHGVTLLAVQLAVFGAGALALALAAAGQPVLAALFVLNTVLMCAPHGEGKP